MGSHIVTTARGDSSYIGVPVFLSRSFRHSCIFIRNDRGISNLGDLKGRRIGLPEYQQTAAMWVRGMMLDEFGISASDVSWVTGGLNAPGPGERIKIDLPPEIALEPLGEGKCLDALLRSGEIDAIISPRPPASLEDPTAPVSRLFDDLRAAEVDYYRRTGFFPIMHCLAVRRDIADAMPDLPVKLAQAFARAKALSLEELSLTNVMRVSLPWIAQEYRDTMALMNGNPWPYGFARNRNEIGAMTRYATRDGLAARHVPAEELFHPSTLDLDIA
jgi:4,5-dihydroxyphthalate decarboxylase